MIKSLPRARWEPDGDDDYDDRDRWLDDRDGGNRWQVRAACRNVDSDLFFPIKIRTNVQGEVISEEEPPTAPPEVKEICRQCPVAGRCLERNMNEEYGVFAGTTGYERSLLTKKIVRKRCVTCGSNDLIKNNNQKKEICIACGFSWDIL